MKLRSLFARQQTPPPEIFRPRKPKQHILHIEPNSRGGLSLRWADDDEQIGNYATVADALRVAETNFADAIVVGPKPPARKIA